MPAYISTLSMLVLVMKACIHETLRHLANDNAIMNIFRSQYHFYYHNNYFRTTKHSTVINQFDNIITNHKKINILFLYEVEKLE